MGIESGLDCSDASNRKPSQCRPSGGRLDKGQSSRVATTIQKTEGGSRPDPIRTVLAPATVGGCNVSLAPSTELHPDRPTEKLFRQGILSIRQRGDNLALSAIDRKVVGKAIDSIADAVEASNSLQTLSSDDTAEILAEVKNLGEAGHSILKSLAAAKYLDDGGLSVGPQSAAQLLRHAAAFVETDPRAAVPTRPEFKAKFLEAAAPGTAAAVSVSPIAAELTNETADVAGEVVQEVLTTGAEAVFGAGLITGLRWAIWAIKSSGSPGTSESSALDVGEYARLSAHIRLSQTGESARILIDDAARARRSRRSKDLFRGQEIQQGDDLSDRY